MYSFEQWVKSLQEDNTNESSKGPEPSIGPVGAFDKLVEDHRIKFTSKFIETSLSISDKQFVVTFFDHFKYSKQKPVGHIFETKIKAVTFQVAFFGKQQWAAAIINPKTREVTEKFKVAETKIKTLFDLFDRAIDQQSFKDILPVATK